MAEATPNPSANKPPQDPAVTKQRTAKSVVDAFAGQMAAQSSARGGVKDPDVFLGFGGAGNAGYSPLLPTILMPQEKTGKLSEVAGQYYKWDQKTKDKFLTHLGLAGYDTSNMKDGQLAQLWGAYATQASEYYKQGQRVTPWDILTKDMNAREAVVKKPRTVTQSQTNYDMSTREDAHAIFLQAAQSLLGRDPTKAEIKAFQTSLNAYEKANPTVTTTTSNYLGDELQSQTSTTKGGVKEGARQLMAMEDVKRDPEYGAYQAATTYFDAMMDMIGG